MKLGLLHVVGVRKATARKQPAYLRYEDKSLQEFGASKFVTKRLETAENMKVSLDLDLVGMSVQPLNIDLSIRDFIHFSHAEHIYRPQRSCGQGNIFTRVCLSMGEGDGVVCPGGVCVCPGGCLGQCMLGYTPWHMVNDRPVRLLLECILVNVKFQRSPPTPKKPSILIDLD